MPVSHHYRALRIQTLRTVCRTFCTFLRTHHLWGPTSQTSFHSYLMFPIPDQHGYHRGAHGDAVNGQAGALLLRLALSIIGPVGFAHIWP